MASQSGREALLKAVKTICLDFNCLEAVFQHVSNGVTITDEKAKVLYVNPAFTEITGYDFEEIAGDNPGVLHSGRHDKAFYEQMWQDILTKGCWQGEIWNRHKSGKVYPELLTITKIIVPSEHQCYYIAIFNDISFLKADDMQQYNLAFYDSLTLLPNRNLLQDRFSQIEESYQRENHEDRLDKVKQTAVLFIDLNKFKSVNDNYGHLAGDKLLQHVAKTMKNCARGIDTVARIGGDEFVILLPSVNSKSQVTKFYQRIVKQLQHPVTIQNQAIQASISVGVAFFPQQADNCESILQCADKAMYYAKKNKLGLSFYEGNRSVSG